jgi:5-methyltetrahydrofolate--homocysteine methyltransferase
MLIIGENINATSKKVAEAIRTRNSSFLQGLASAQVAADYLDVNVGGGEGSAEQEIEDIKWLIDIVCEIADKPLVVDSANPEVIEAGLQRGVLAMSKERSNRVAMINSVNAERVRLEAIGPLVAKYQVNIIALAMDDKGVRPRVEERIEACDKIIEGLSRYGIPAEKIYFDPLVLPIGVDASQGRVTLKTLEQIKARYPEAKTIVGLSNISYGLPQRPMINDAFLLMLMSAGLDSVIMNPLRSSTIGSIRLGEMLLGRDAHCKEYLKAYRRGLFNA